MKQKLFKYLSVVKVCVKIMSLEELKQFEAALELEFDKSEQLNLPWFVSLYGKTNTNEIVVAHSVRKDFIGFRIIDIPNLLAENFVLEQVWQSHVNNNANDLTQLQFRLAVFCVLDQKIYKLTGIDYRGLRYDVSGDKMTRWLRFDDAILFDFTNEVEFTKYFNHHKQKSNMSMEKMLTWLSATSSRLGFIEEN